MGSITVSTDVRFRDNFGRYAAMCDIAGQLSARELTDHAGELASEYAPVGPARKDYGRRPKLSSSIETEMVGPKSGRIFSRAGHAGAQEKGARPHIIPNAFGRGFPVLHPGNAPQPYFAPAIRALRVKVMGILERRYPG